MPKWSPYEYIILQKKRLVTLILFDLCLFKHFSLSQIFVISLYVWKVLKNRSNEIQTNKIHIRRELLVGKFQVCYDIEEMKFELPFISLIGSVHECQFFSIIPYLILSLTRIKLATYFSIFFLWSFPCWIDMAYYNPYKHTS